MDKERKTRCKAKKRNRFPREMWDCQNKQTHDPKGPRQTAIHKELNEQVDDKIATGEVGLTPDRTKIMREHTAEALHAMTPSTKNQWLRHIRQSREECEDPTATVERDNHQALTNWLEWDRTKKALLKL